jgi:hypothetical protein
MDNFATASRNESEPFPQPGLGAYKGTLWDPTAKIAARSHLALGAVAAALPGGGRAAET